MQQKSRFVHGVRELVRRLGYFGERPHDDSVNIRSKI